MTLGRAILWIVGSIVFFVVCSLLLNLRNCPPGMMTVFQDSPWENTGFRCVPPGK
jgi:hypothetical protein